MFALPSNTACFTMTGKKDITETFFCTEDCNRILTANTPCMDKWKTKSFKELQLCKVTKETQIFAPLPKHPPAFFTAQYISLPSGLQFLLHCVISFRTSHAGWTLSQGGVTVPLLRSFCLDSQCMNTVAQLLLQSLINHTVALY